jgi:hypothetical protein
MAAVLSDGFKNRMKPPYILGVDPRIPDLFNQSSACGGKMLPPCAAAAADACHLGGLSSSGLNSVNIGRTEAVFMPSD